MSHTQTVSDVTAATSPIQDSRLLALPTEIRLHIYSFLLPDLPKTLDTELRSHDNKLRKTTQEVATTDLQPLMLSCGTIRDEADELFSLHITCWDDDLGCPNIDALIQMPDKDKVTGLSIKLNSANGDHVWFKLGRSATSICSLLPTFANLTSLRLQLYPGDADEEFLHCGDKTLLLVSGLLVLARGCL